MQTGEQSCGKSVRAAGGPSPTATGGTGAKAEAITETAQGQINTVPSQSTNNNFHHGQCPHMHSPSTSDYLITSGALASPNGDKTI